MAKTRAYTRTAVLPSLVIIRIQVATALRRGASISDNSLSAVKRGIDERWIRAIVIYGLDDQGLCRAGFVLAIDWAANQLRIESGRDLVEVGDSWRDNVAPEVGEMVTEFVEFCRERDLKREWRVRYTPGTDKSEIQSELGFRTVDSPKWAGPTAVLSERVHGVSEIEATIRLVAD